MEAEQRPTLISLFTGAMGLDLGFQMEGFDIRVTLDNNKDVIETIRLNRPSIQLIGRDIFKVKTSEILDRARLRVGEATIVTGGPPCQPFSTAGRRLSVEEKKGQLVFQFLRVVKETQPRFFLFENVSGLLSAARKHISFYTRIDKKKEELAPKERLGSAFDRILEEFKKVRTSDGSYYVINWAIVNAADYGTPQKRKRLIILGSRSGKKLSFPNTTHASPKSLDTTTGMKKPWVTLKDAIGDLDDPNPEGVPFPSWGKYMKYIPEGGYWRDLPEELKKEAMKGAYYSQGGRTGFFRRLSWSKPSPTLVTSPVFKGTCLAHPEENRPLSVREYARIQGFPDNWKFIDPISTKYGLIGEAVPIALARALARQILKEIARERSQEAARIEA